MAWVDVTGPTYWHAVDDGGAVYTWDGSQWVGPNGPGAGAFLLATDAMPEYTALRLMFAPNTDLTFFTGALTCGFCNPAINPDEGSTPIDDATYPMFAGEVLGPYGIDLTYKGGRFTVSRYFYGPRDGRFNIVKIEAFTSGGGGGSFWTDFVGCEETA